MGELLDVGPSIQIARHAEQAGQSLGMVFLDVLGPAGQIVEHITVSGKTATHVGQFSHRIERREEAVQRIRTRSHPGDVWRDGGQHMIARDECAVLGVEQAEVIQGVSRCMHHLPAAVTNRQDFAMTHPFVRHRQRPASVHQHQGLAAQFRVVLLRRKGATPRRRSIHAGVHPPRLLIGQIVLAGVGVGMARIVAIVHGAVVVAFEHGAKRPVGDQFCSGLRTQAHGVAVVVRMGVRDEHRMDVGHPQFGLPKAILQVAP